MAAAVSTVGKFRRPAVSGDLAAVLLLIFLTAVAITAFAVFLDQPFWLDEQSRAYQVGLAGLHMGLGNSYAPLSLGWVLIEKAAIAVLPTTELVLRLPELLCLLALGPSCYLLARKLMPPAVAFLVAAALVCYPANAYYGTQFKAYIVEALATVLILLVWARAREEAAWSARLRWYAAIAVLGLFSVSAPFVIAPLFALDLVDAARAPRGDALAIAQRIAGPLGAGAVVLAYFVGFVLPQSFAAGYNAWNGFYPPHSAVALWHFLVAEAPTYLVGAVTAVPAFDTSVIMSIFHTDRFLSDAIELILFLLVLAGILELRRHVVGRGAIVAALAGLLLQFAASWDRHWPFGLTRAGIFYVPLVYLLAGGGVVGVGRHLRRGRRARWPAAIFLVATAAVAVTAEAQNLRNERDLLRQMPISRLLGDVRPAVAAARLEYRPGTLAYLWIDGMFRYGAHAKGWVFYMDDYDWSGPTRSAPRIPLADTYFAGAYPDPLPELTAYLARHPAVNRLIVAGVSGMSPTLVNAGFRLTWERYYPKTFLLMVWVRTPAAAIAH